MVDVEVWYEVSFIWEWVSRVWKMENGKMKFECFLGMGSGKYEWSNERMKWVVRR